MTRTLTSVDIEEFRSVWREAFDEELSLDRARSEAERLLRILYDIVTISRRDIKHAE